MRFIPLFLWFYYYLGATAQHTYTLGDFYSHNAKLDSIVAHVYASLTDTQRIGQMIVTAAGEYGKTPAEINKLIKHHYVGGILLLKGEQSDFKKWVKNFDMKAASYSSVPLLYSADAEPSLIQYKIKGVPPFIKTSEIKNDMMTDSVVMKINTVLKGIGIKHNYAPVVDKNSNKEIIGNRSFGGDEESLIRLSKRFAHASQQDGIIATAKHFPGHGNVRGDSHKELVYIDGPLNEVSHFKALIDAGVLSVMVGHIAIKNNTRWATENGWPATCSHKIVTDLLRKELGFNGIIITDAMNMKALRSISRPSLKAVQAGCDMILMPSGEKLLIGLILSESAKDKNFAAQIEASVKRIIRLKICANIL